MRRTAVLIIVVGFLFAYFTLMVAGIDLLIDAVGFLLVWNGVRVLAAKEKGFGFSGPVCLALVGISALQLFFAGWLAWVLVWLRSVAEIALYAMMTRGFLQMLRKNGGRADRVLLAVAVAGVMLAALVPPMGLLQGAGTLYTAAWWVATVLHAGLLLALGRCAVVLHRLDAQDAGKAV